MTAIVQTADTATIVLIPLHRLRAPVCRTRQASAPAGHRGRDRAIARSRHQAPAGPATPD